MEAEVERRLLKSSAKEEQRWSIDGGEVREVEAKKAPLFLPAGELPLFWVHNPPSGPVHPQTGCELLKGRKCLSFIQLTESYRNEFNIQLLSVNVC